MTDTKDFPMALKEWRQKQGLTQKELGELLGLSNWAISNYEQGREFPSKEIAIKLASVMCININDVPSYRHQPLRCDAPLDEEEQRFAEQHHGCIYAYLNKHRLSESDWYDIVVFGYLHAVKMWFVRSDLHKYSFLTIAYNYMRSAVSTEMRKQRNRSEYRLVSLDEVIPGTNGLTYADMLCDPRDCVGI